jgi:uncharacterized protein
VTSWDANSGKTPEELLDRLEALPLIAERGWAKAAKDVSNAGLLGTVSIMMENSSRGAILDLMAIPCPEGIPLADWLTCFQSFGFVLSVAPEQTKNVISLFKEKNIDAAVIGRVVKERRVTVIRGSESGTLFDFQVDKITGISCPLAESTPDPDVV